MGINDLPIEILCSVFSYLDVNDLSSCCLTSKYWRDVINNDHTWEKLCASRFLISRKDMPKLRTSEVEPRFVIPRMCRELSPVCHWRLNYMKQAHISRNLRKQKCVKIPLNICIFQCKGDLLVDNRSCESVYLVYKVDSNKLVKIQAIPFKSAMYPNEFKLFKEKLICVKETFVYVFTRNKLSGLFDETNKFFFYKDIEETCEELEDLVNQVRPDGNSEDNARDIDYGIHNSLKILFFTCDENHFVGCINDLILKKCAIHIWDLNSRQKICQKVVEGTYFNDNEIYLLLSKLFLKSNGEDSEPSIICFCLNSLNFTDLRIPCLDVNIFSEKFIISVANCRYIKIWNIEDGSLLHIEEIQFTVCKDAIKVYSHASIIVIAGCFIGTLFQLPHTIVKVISTKTFETLYNMELDVNHFARSVYFIPPNFILVTCCSRYCNLKVCDIITKSILWEICGYCHWVSPNRSKILMEYMNGDLQFLNFW